MPEEKRRRPGYDEDLLFLASKEEQLSWAVNSKDPVKALEYSVDSDVREGRRGMSYRICACLGCFLILETTNMVHKHFTRNAGAFSKKVPLNPSRGFATTVATSIFAVFGGLAFYNGYHLMQLSSNDLLTHRPKEELVTA